MSDRHDDLVVMTGPAWGARLLHTGGAHDGEGRAEAQMIDLSEPEPFWRDIAPMAHPRWFPNSVLLPDNRLFVCGGGRVENGDPVMEPELFDPVTETWTTDVPMEVPRLYHSTALLLPDGRVWVAGTDGETRMEVYSPDYLFAGPRPVLFAAPESVTYNQTFPDPDGGRCGRRRRPLHPAFRGHACLEHGAALLATGVRSDRSGGARDRRATRSERGPTRALHALHQERRRRAGRSADRPARGDLTSEHDATAVSQVLAGRECAIPRCASTRPMWPGHSAPECASKLPDASCRWRRRHSRTRDRPAARPADLTPRLPMGIILQEVSREPRIDTLDQVQNYVLVYGISRSTFSRIGRTLVPGVARRCGTSAEGRAWAELRR